MATTARSEPSKASRLIPIRQTGDAKPCTRCGLNRSVRNNRPNATGLCRDCNYTLTPTEIARWAA
jgi:hypothetical protein